MTDMQEVFDATEESLLQMLWDNRLRQDFLIERAAFESMSSESVLKEIQTIQFDPGRQTGKTVSMIKTIGRLACPLSREQDLPFHGPAGIAAQKEDQLLVLQRKRSLFGCKNMGGLVVCAHLGDDLNALRGWDLSSLWIDDAFLFSKDEMARVEEMAMVWAARDKPFVLVKLG